MAKDMAALENGTVVNMIWCSDSQPETETLKNPGDRPVGIGDSYADGKWYRSGVEILTPLEEERKRAAEYAEALKEAETRNTEYEAAMEDAARKNGEFETALSEIEAALGVNT